MFNLNDFKIAYGIRFISSLFYSVTSMASMQMVIIRHGKVTAQVIWQTWARVLTVIVAPGIKEFMFSTLLVSIYDIKHVTKTIHYTAVLCPLYGCIMLAL